MFDILKTKLFWGLTLFISAVIFMAFLNANQSYVVYTDILLIPKSAVTAVSVEQIVANAKIIPTELSFYENILSQNEDMADPSQEMLNHRRKNYWNEKIRADFLGRSGILRLSVSDSGMEEAKKLNAYSTRELIRELSGFYNIKTDLDIRIIDGPIARSSRNVNPFLAAIASLLSGMIITVLVIKFADKVEEAVVRSEIMKKASKSSPLEFFRRFDNLNRSYEEPYEIPKKKEVEEKPETIMSATPEKQPEIEKEEDIKKAVKEDSKREVAVKDRPEAKEKEDMTKKAPVISFGKKGAAPENLPVMKEEDVFKVRLAKPEEQEEKNDIIKEPTQEEVKERLNKLLSGKF